MDLNPITAIRTAFARAASQVRELQPADVPWMNLAGLSLTRPADLAAVMHATRLCVEPLATMPGRVRYRGRLLDAPRWYTDPMLMRPDARFPGAWAPAPHRKTGPEFWSQLFTDALWNGLGCLVFQDDATGQPVAGSMRVVPSVFVQTVGTGDQARWRIASGVGPSIDFDYDGRVVGAPSFRMLVLRDEPPYDPITGRGLGVIQRAAADLELMGRIQRYSAGVYRSGIPSGYLKVTSPGLTKDESDRLKASWDEARSGEARTTAVLNNVTEYHPIQISPEDMAVIDAKRLSLLDVALAFGVPPYQLGSAQSTSTYSNTESELMGLVTMRLNQRAARVEALLSSLLPAGHTFDIDFRAMLKGDTKTRLDYYTGMVAIGSMSPQLVAEEEGYDWDRVSRDLAALAPKLPDPEPEPEDEPDDDAEEGDEDEPAQ